jgi:hypothetical protein
MLKRSGPLEAEEEMSARQLNRRKGKQEVGQGADHKAVGHKSGCIWFFEF